MHGIRSALTNGKLSSGEPGAQERRMPTLCQSWDFPDASLLAHGKSGPSPCLDSEPPLRSKPDTSDPPQIATWGCPLRPRACISCQTLGDPVSSPTSRKTGLPSSA